MGKVQGIRMLVKAFCTKPATGKPVQQLAQVENMVQIIANSKLVTGNPAKEQIKFLEYCKQLGKRHPNNLQEFADSNVINMPEKCPRLLTGNGDELKNFNRFFKKAKNTFFSKNFLKTHGNNKLNVVKDFPKTAGAESILAEIAPGNVCTIENKLLVNNGNELVPLKLSKEKFLELFPQDKLACTRQGVVADCWFVTGATNLMDKPKGRAFIYQMFEQQGDDIIIKFGGKKALKQSFGDKWFTTKSPNLEDYTYTVRFKDGKLPDTNKSMDSVKGLRMFEAAYTAKRSGNSIVEISENTDISTLMNCMKGGKSYDMLRELMQYEYKFPAKGFKIGHYLNSDGKLSGQFIIKGKKDMTEMLDKYANSKDNVMYASISGAKFTKRVCKNPFLYRKHAYSVRGYDKASQTVYIANPWDDKIICEVPLKKFTRNFEQLGWFNIKS